MYRNILVALALSTITMAVHAGYNANFSGKLTHVLTYPYSKDILIRVEGMPKTHPTCTNLDYLVLAADVDDQTRQIVFSRLLTAYAKGERVNIGYDKEGGCIGGRIRIHRVG